MSSFHECLSNEAAPAANVSGTPITTRVCNTCYNCEPPPLQNKIKSTLAYEMKDRFVGPLGAEQFLMDYLPCSASMPPAPRLSEEELETLKKVAAATSEIDMYSSFKMALERCTRGMVFADMGSKMVKDSFPFRPPSFCLYEEAVTTSGETDFSTMEMCIDAKPSLSYDPFEDPDAKSNNPFEKDTVEANDMRGEISMSVVAQFNSQFRIFAFSIIVVEDHARFVRWDRAGAIVSTCFNYLERSDLLANFFWRFSHLSHEERGYDSSVFPSALSEREAQKVRNTLDLKAGTPLSAFTVTYKDSDKLFYGPRLPLPVCSLIGQSTRMIPVCDFVNGEPGQKVFLKEYWRPAGMRGEAEVYEHLIKHDIPHITPLLCGGDVPRSETRTHWRAEKANSCLIGHRYLHRLVLGFVGRRLTQFNSTRELAQAVYHAMKAHWKAFQKAGVLHRDVSVNNILIDENGNGVLIDWELAVFIDDKSDFEVQDRVGTWQFISAELLQDPGQTHHLVDDIESFVHVLGWIVMCYVPNTMDRYICKELVSLLYDHSFKLSTGREVGGLCKATYLASRNYPPPEFKLKTHSPILALIRTLASPFYARYGIPSTEEEKQAFERIKAGVSEGLVDEELPSTPSVHRYLCAEKRLKSSEWFLKTIEDALARPDWPKEGRGDSALLSDAEGASKQQLAEKFTETQAQLVSVPSHPLKRLTTLPLPDPPDKRAHLDNNRGSGEEKMCMS